MSDIDQWSDTAGGNNAPAPDGFPEGMPPSAVNDSTREVMAAIKRWYDAIGGENVDAATLGGDSLSDINNRISEAEDDAARSAYPVGSLYFNANTSTNPNTLLGFGSWSRFGQGRMILSQGNGYANGSTGGAATHTLTTSEMPSHSHNWAGKNGNSNYGTGANDVHYTQGGESSDDAIRTGGTARTDPGRFTTDVGGGQPHNNMPPYITVYVWQRTS